MAGQGVYPPFESQMEQLDWDNLPWDGMGGRKLRWREFDGFVRAAMLAEARLRFRSSLSSLHRRCIVAAHVAASSKHRRSGQRHWESKGQCGWARKVARIQQQQSGMDALTPQRYRCNDPLPRRALDAYCYVYWHL